jgi:hypothetical protein
MLAAESPTTPQAGDPSSLGETPRGEQLEIARAPDSATDRPSRDARRSARERSAPLQRADERARLRAERRAQREAMIAERRRVHRSRTVPHNDPEAPRAWQRMLGSPGAPPADAVPDAAAAVPEAGPAPPPDAAPDPRIAEPTERAADAAGEATAALPAPLDARGLVPVPTPRVADEPESGAEPGRAAEDGEAGQAPAPPTEEAAQPPLSAEEEILRKPPRGAPRVRVSFLFYSKDPGRRRVMLTLNDTPDLVTAYEGQRIEAFEIARILPDEVHLRYEGKVFAIQPRY